MAQPKPGKAAPLHKLAELFPSMTADEFVELKNHIKAHGQKEDIVLLDGKVLDGANRQSAMIELKIKPRYREYDYTKDGASPLDFVAAKNLHRRNLTASQRAAIAAEIHAQESSEEKQPKKPATSSPKSTPVASKGNAGKPATQPPPPTPAPTIKEAAKAAGASERTTKRAARIQKADPELHDQVKAGKITVSAAEKQLTAGERAQRDREAAIGRIQSVCGKSLAQAVGDGTRLKKKGEAVEYAELPDDKMIELRGLIENGWTLKDALKYKFNSLTAGHRIKDLIERAQAQGSNFLLEINGWEITCQRKATA